MWGLAAIILIVSGGVTCFNEQCAIKLGKMCRPQRWQTHFPKNAMELEASCRTTRYNLHKCLLDHNQDCNSAEDRIQYLRMAVGFLERECVPRSWIFKAISSHLECLKSTVPKVNTVCYEDYISGMWKKSAKAQLRNRYIRRYTEDDVTTCLDGIWEDACTAMVIEKECQIKTADAALVVLLKMDDRIPKCQRFIIYEISAFIEDTSLVESVDDSIKLAKLIEKDRNRN